MDEDTHLVLPVVTPLLLMITSHWTWMAILVISKLRNMDYCKVRFGKLVILESIMKPDFDPTNFKNIF